MKYFLDSNVIADWVLISDKIEKNENFEFNDKILEKRFKVMSYSYTLIEILFNQETNDKVLVSNFALAETYDVIYNELLCEKLFEKAIPYTLWQKRHTIERPSESKINIFRTQIFKHIGKLKKKSIIVKDEIDDKIFPFFYHQSDIGKYDSLLLSTAIINHSDYFLSRDTKIIDFRKKRKFTNNKEKFKIEINKPQEIIRAFNTE